jgi:hypothetical protein
MILTFKHDFLAIKKKYQDAMKYYGTLNKTSSVIMNKYDNKQQIPVILHSRTMSKQTSLPRFPLLAFLTFYER